MNNTLRTIPTKELADCLGTSQAFVSQIKAGKRKLPSRHCLKVSALFGIPPEDLRPDLAGIFCANDTKTQAKNP